MTFKQVVLQCAAVSSQLQRRKLATAQPLCLSAPEMSTYPHAAWLARDP